LREGSKRTAAWGARLARGEEPLIDVAGVGNGERDHIAFFAEKGELIAFACSRDGADRDLTTEQRRLCQGVFRQQCVHDRYAHH